MTLLEPAVTLTDLGLAVECGLFAAWLARRPGADTLRRGWILFFLALALAALLGFVAHGFLADKQSLPHLWVWTGTLLAIGAAACAAASVAAGLLFEPATARRATRLALVLLALYTVVVISGYRRFAIAIAAYAPAILILLAAFVVRARRAPARHWWLGIGGLVLTALAAAVQQFGIGLHAVHFNHNALYHVIQALALWLLYESARRIPAGGEQA